MEELLPEQHPTSFDRSQGRDELNLAEFPLFYLGQRVPKGLDKLTFENEIHDPSRNRKVKRRLEIQAGGCGLPTVCDQDVLDALILIAKATTDLKSREILFSRYQLCEILGWPQNGKSYKRIETAIRRWVTVTIFFQAWWKRGGEEDDGGWANLKGFHIIDSIELNDYNTGRVGRTNQLDLPMSKVRLGEPLFESLSRGNMKQLNLADLFHLKLATAKRLYRFLDKRFYHNPTLDFDLRTLCCTHVGLSTAYKPSEFKRKLLPAIKELEGIGFLTEMHPEQRFVRVGHGVYRVYFKRATREKIGELPLKGTKQQRTADRQLIKELANFGMTAAVARRIVEDPQITDERIREKLEMLQWYQDKDSDEAPKNPGGWLAKAIKEDWSAPVGFETKEQRAASAARVAEFREQREKELRQAKQQEEKQLAEGRQRDAEKWARVNAHVDALSNRERVELMEAVAIDPANSFIAKKFRRYLEQPTDIDEVYYQMAMMNHLGMQTEPA